MSSTRVDRKVFQRTDFGSFGWIAKVPEDLWEVYYESAIWYQPLSFRTPRRQHRDSFRQQDPHLFIVPRPIFIAGEVSASFLGGAPKVTSEGVVPTITVLGSAPKVKI